MRCQDRYEEYKDTSLDSIISQIKTGRIKCGRYSHLVKIDKNVKMSGKEFLTNGKDDSKSK